MTFIFLKGLLAFGAKRALCITLCATVVLAAHAQDVKFEWAKQLTATAPGTADISSLLVDSTQNLIFAGTLFGTMDFDPGMATSYLTTTANNSHLTCFDKNGTLKWAKAIPIQYPRLARYKGYVYMVGRFDYAADVDPGPGVTVLTPVNDLDACILKFDLDGNFIWGKSIGTFFHDVAESVAVDADGNVYFSGYSYGYTIDLDPGPGVASFTNSPTTVFIVKLDSLGAFSWGYTQDLQLSFCPPTTTMDADAAGNCYLSYYGCGGPIKLFKITNGVLVWDREVGYEARIKAGPGGSIYLVGKTSGPVDFDPGPATYLVNYANQPAGYPYPFIAKFKENGDFSWAKNVFEHGPFVLATGTDVAIDTAGQLYMASGGMDVILPSTTSNVFKLDTAGNQVWAKEVCSDDVGWLVKVAVGQSDNVYSSSLFTYSADFDPGADVFTMTSSFEEVYIHRLSYDSCSGMKLAVDSLSHVGCSNQGLIHVNAIDGTPPYTYTWSTTPPLGGPNLSTNSPGTYTVTCTDSVGCTRTKSLLLNGPIYSIGFDLDVNLIVPAGFIPGVTTMLTVEAFNTSCGAVNGMLKVALPANLIYDNANPAPDQIIADTLVWNFTNQYYGASYLQPEIWVTTATSATIGDSVYIAALVTPTAGDLFIGNNSRHYTIPVATSYDPNDKRVYPPGVCPENFVDADTKLRYTINFQNTGTAMANRVYILDTLNASLSVDSVKLKGSSHSMYAEVLPGNVLKFVFEHISLPDSNTNEPASHGYVTFEVNPVQGTPNHTQITNSVGIYFDFNQPVQTNYTKNTVVDTIPSCGLTVAEVEKDLFDAYPNPATTSITVTYDGNGVFVLSDILGRTQKAVTLRGAGKATIDISDLAGGIYAYSYTTKAGRKSGKLVVVR
jgi:uncharacterized repeat protein (TIGR01451 family)